eukprot:4336891-Pyramimonas_sp.AAC.1
MHSAYFALAAWARAFCDLVIRRSRAACRMTGLAAKRQGNPLAGAAAPVCKRVPYDALVLL